VSAAAFDASAWVGRRRSVRVRAVRETLEWLEAALDRPEPGPDAPMQPLRHWLWMFAPPAPPGAALGPDGHPTTGTLTPDWPLPRRMWASSDVRFLEDVAPDTVLERETVVESATVKPGRSGTLGFVVQRHRWLLPDGRCAIDDAQTAVYREAVDAPAGATAAAGGRPASPSPPSPPSSWASPGAPGSAPEATSGAGGTASRPAPAADAPASADAGRPAWAVGHRPAETLLFRYSALSFNTHRIHYDLPYVTGVEGYPALVVHGPLLATLMLDACRDANPAARVRRFRFRALSPAFCGRPIRCGGAPSGERAARLWVRGADGTEHLSGEVDFD
jgi:3-methylfumaryl-CoA hydratase